MVFAVSRIVPVSVVALAVLGACQVLYYATTNTLLQVLVPARLRGRVMSLYILTSWGLIPIGNVMAGMVAERSSATLALVAGALVTLVAVLVAAVAVPELRRIGAARPRSSRRAPAAGARGSRDVLKPLRGRLFGSGEAAGKADTHQEGRNTMRLTDATIRSAGGAIVAPLSCRRRRIRHEQLQ